MKKKILIALTILIGVLQYSCLTTKKTINNQRKVGIPVSESIAEVETKVETEVKKVEPVKLPETKEDLNFTRRNYEEAEEYKEDFYGNKFNDYNNIPIYDINNLPISVWFIKEGDDFKGFIVAGHATKAVCEVASLEVHNKIKAIGKSGLLQFFLSV